MGKKIGILGLAVGLMLSGCGGSGLGTGSVINSSYLGTQSPGDVWSWDLAATTFTASNDTLSHHYTGTKETLPTGFLKLQISTTDDPNVAVGQTAYALEIPGTALLIKPAGADTNPPIVAGALGGNPPGPQVSFNFVAVGAKNFNVAADQAYGHVTFDVTGDTYTGTSHRWELDGTALPDGPSNFTGVNGLMTDTSGPQGTTATGAMTPSGVCVLDYGPNNGGVIGVRQPATNVDLTAIGAKSYRGILTMQGKTQCVAVTPNGDGTLHGAGYANPTGVETGTFDNGSGVTVTFTGQPNPGEITMSLSTSGGSELMVACVSQVNGKYILFCFGADSLGAPHNVILVEN
jgi:hypothetical protein